MRLWLRYLASVNILGEEGKGVALYLWHRLFSG